MKVTNEEVAALVQKTGMTEEQVLQGLAKEGLEPETMGGKALDFAGRLLDATGGVTRTGLAQAGEALTGADLYKEGDWSKAIEGKAPSTEELLGRGGMEEGATRSTLGFVGDVALDPAVLASGTIKAGGSLLSKLASVVGKKQAAQMIAKSAAKGAAASRFLNPTEVAMQVPGLKQVGEATSKALSKGLDKTGRFIYQDRALQALDQEAEKYGKKKMSDIMYEQGMSGPAGSVLGIKGLDKKVREYNNRLLAERAGILEDIGGTKVNPDDILQAYAKESSNILDPLDKAGRNIEKKAAYDEATRMGKEWFEPLKKSDIMGEVSAVVPSNRPLTYSEQSLGAFTPVEMGTKVVKKGEIPQGNLSQLTDIMTSVNQAVGSGAYKGGAINPASVQQLRELSKVARKEMYEAAKKADPEKAARMADINEEISAILSTAKKMESEAGKSVSTVGVGPMLSTVAAADPLLAGAALVGKGTVFTLPRTKLGLGFKKASKAASRKDAQLTDILDAVARQTGAKALKEED